MIIPGSSPSDQELMSNYLLKKLNGKTLDFRIPEIDVYAIEPWKLFSNNDETTSTTNNLRYLFTKNTKKNSGERMNRIVTISLSSSSTESQVVVGTWKGQTSSTKIKDEISDNIMGVKKMYTFMPKNDHDEEDDKLNGFCYTMHEYSMDKSSYVLCRIRRKMKNSCSKNTIIRKNTAPSAFAQNLADMLLDTPTGTTAAQDVEDIMVPNAFAQGLLADNKIPCGLLVMTGVQNKKIEELSSQQQKQQPPALLQLPAPTSAGEAT